MMSEPAAGKQSILCGSDLFPTLHILASLPENNSRLTGAQTGFPTGAPLWWQGTP